MVMGTALFLEDQELSSGCARFEGPTAHPIPNSPGGSGGQHGVPGRDAVSSVCRHEAGQRHLFKCRQRGPVLGPLMFSGVCVWGGSCRGDAERAAIKWRDRKVVPECM